MRLAALAGELVSALNKMSPKRVPKKGGFFSPTQRRWWSQLVGRGWWVSTCDCPSSPSHAEFSTVETGIKHVLSCTTCSTNPCRLLLELETTSQNDLGCQAVFDRRPRKLKNLIGLPNSSKVPPESLQGVGGYQLPCYSFGAIKPQIKA